MNAGDAHYATLLDSIREGQARRKASSEAFDAGERRYWYFVYEDYCPVCGSIDQTRERMYTPRPDRWEDRHKGEESYDGCEGY